MKEKRTLRFIFALWVAKAMKLALKLLGRNGTYLPGNTAIRLCPNFLGQVGKPKTVIHKSLVNLKQKAFLEFSQKRASWRIKDQYCSPGPIQFAGSRDLTDSVPITLKLNRS